MIRIYHYELSRLSFINLGLIFICFLVTSHDYIPLLIYALIVHIALMAAYHMNKGRKGNVLIQAANVCYFMMLIMKFVLPKSIIKEIAKYSDGLYPIATFIIIGLGVYGLFDAYRDWTRK